MRVMSAAARLRLKRSARTPTRSSSMISSSPASRSSRVTPTQPAPSSASAAFRYVWSVPWNDALTTAPPWTSKRAIRFR
ncbi:Uncharacterised protein [Mycobacteroides abscessus subsp. abscessus]|nr:Uncharacterised protein [Mycobacteroides abscessus subsp. abscessus]